MRTLYFPARPPDPDAKFVPLVLGHIRPPTPAVICSYCRAEIRSGSRPVSHGICQGCLEEHWPEVAT